jgi:hypothetical protein
LAAIVALAIVCSQHATGGVKGAYIPMPNVAESILIAAIAAIACIRYWRPFPAPFVAGIAGAFGILDFRFGPYGGIVGFLTGLLIALAVSFLHINHCPSSTVPK